MELNGFEKLKEQKKRSIKQAAFELFSTFGVNKITIRDIATKANVSPVTIYNHFENKYQLFFEVVQDFINDQFSKMEAIIKSNQSTKEKIEALILEKTKEMNRFNPLFFQELIQDRGEIQQYIQDFSTQKSLPLFIELIDKGKQEGEINPDLSSETILFYIDLLNKGIQESPDFFIVNDYKFSKELVEIFFYGLMLKK